jgi:large subunit ribosomal protein L25
MQTFEIRAEQRTDKGKGASRRLRRAGQIPGILYGGHKDPVALQMNNNEMVKHLQHEAFYSHILTLNCGGNIEKVVLKDMQRHPYKPQVLHIDLLRVDEHEKLAIRVPLHFINEEKCVGVKQEGGTVSHLMTELEIVCLPKDLPEYIEVDVADVHVGHAVHFSEITLPAGVEIASLAHGGDAAQAVFSVHIPRVQEEVEGAATPVPGTEAGPTG